MHTIKEDDKNAYKDGDKQDLIEYLPGKGISLKNDLIPFYSPTIAFFPVRNCHLTFSFLRIQPIYNNSSELLEDTQTEKGKIILYGVHWVELPQDTGQFFDCLPVVLLSLQYP